LIPPSLPLSSFNSVPSTTLRHTSSSPPPSSTPPPHNTSLSLRSLQETGKKQRRDDVWPPSSSFAPGSPFLRLRSGSFRTGEKSDADSSSIRKRRSTSPSRAKCSSPRNENQRPPLSTSSTSSSLLLLVPLLQPKRPTPTSTFIFL